MIGNRFFRKINLSFFLLAFLIYIFLVTGVVSADSEKPVSIINSPPVSSWQNKDFLVDVNDSDNVALDYCQYRVWSYNGTSYVNTKSWTNRTCNSPITITVGYGKDCRDQGNDTCRVRVIAFDNSSNNATDTRLFSIDWTGPGIHSLKPTNNSYTNDTTPEISASYYDMFSGIDISSVIIEVDGVDKTSEATVTSSKVTYIPLVALGEGKHNVTVKVNDTLGNPSQKTWLFTVDITPPVIDIISPQNKSYDTKKISVEVNITNEEVDSIKRSVDGTHFFNLCTDCSYVKKSLSFDEGSITLMIAAEDYAGNTAYGSVNFFVDSIPPRIIETLPEDGDVVQGTEFYIKYTEENLVNILLYWKESNETNYNVENVTGCPAGKYKECSIDINLSSYEGDVNYYFEVQDPTHNVTSSVKTITIDNINPTVTILSPEQKIYPGKKIYLTVNVDETIEKLEYSLDGGVFKTLCDDCNVYNKTKTFSDGNHTLSVKATDYAGNVGQSSLNFSVDSKKPIIIRQYPANNKFTNGTFSVVYTEDNLKNISLFYKGVLESTYKNVTKDNCASGKNQECNFNVDLTSYDGGHINYYFVVRDHVSETNSMIYTETVDTSSPLLTIYSPQNITYGSRRILIDISVNEDVKLEYSYNGGKFVRLCTSCDSYDEYRYFSYGFHEVIIRAIDKAGNEASSIFVFNII